MFVPVEFGAAREYDSENSVNPLKTLYRRVLVYLPGAFRRWHALLCQSATSCVLFPDQCGFKLFRLQALSYPPSGPLVEITLLHLVIGIVWSVFDDRHI